MTRDDILRMAREAGASVYKNRHYIDRPFNTFNPEQLERFFRLAYAAGAAAERDECAKVCFPKNDRPDWTEYAEAQAACAAAIRARGTK